MRKNFHLFWIALWSTISGSSGWLVSHPSKGSCGTYKKLQFMSSTADSGLGYPNSKPPKFRTFFRFKKTSMNSNPASKMDSSELSESSEPAESPGSLNIAADAGDDLTATGDPPKNDTPTPSPPQTDGKKDKAFVDQLYDKIKSIFEPNNNQILVMEFPGRVLDEETYKFKNDKSIYSNTLKPQVVLEEEFRLTDDVFDVPIDENGEVISDKGHIVGGPSGMKVSMEYKEALAKLVPKFDDFKSLFSDRITLRKWLLETVTDEIDEQKFKGTRMELYNELNERYENAKKEWEDNRAKKLKEAQFSLNPSEALDEYARFIARDGQQIEDEIATKYNDLVVRGYYHEVRRMLGYMDVASASELLEEAKSKMRQTAMLSFDESETIYPIQMQPVSWAKSLSTDFTPEDLLLSPDLVNAELMQKLDRKQELESQIQNLSTQPTGDVAEIEEKIETAQTAQDNATKDMLDNFTEATFTAMKIAYQLYCSQNDKNPLELATVTSLLKKDLGDLSNKKKLSDDDFQKFQNFQKTNIQAQLSLNQANRELNFELEAKAQAETTQSKDAINLLQTQLEELNTSINSLKQIALAGDKASSNSTLPSNRAIANEWINIQLSTTKDSTVQDSTMTSSSSFQKTSVNFLFGSYGSSTDKEFSDFKSKYSADKTTIDVGMRVTKVTLDRGGWLAPDVLKASDGLYRTSESKYTDVFATYPVAFIIAKDITINYTFSEENVKQGAKYAHEASQSGGGFLCFSHSSGKSSTSSSKSAYSGYIGEQVVIKIPGPQILMWELEKVPKDSSSMYPDSGALSKEVKEMLDPNPKPDAKEVTLNEQDDI